MYVPVIKPFLDVLASIVGLILLSPIFIILIIILLVDNKGKPFFYQKRAGKNGKSV